MLNLKVNQVVADNEIMVNGVVIGKLTDNDAQKIIDIINGMMSSSVPSQKSAPVAQQEQKIQKSQKDSKDFPNLGTPTCVIGNITAYKNLVRYWEKGFVPDKVKYGIKMSLKDAGAEWDKANGAFKFPTLKAANDWLKAQKARQSK